MKLFNTDWWLLKRAFQGGERPHVIDSTYHRAGDCGLGVEYGGEGLRVVCGGGGGGGGSGGVTCHGGGGGGKLPLDAVASGGGAGVSDSDWNGGGINDPCYIDIERVLKAAELELGPEVCSAWVEETFAYIRDKGNHAGTTGPGCGGNSNDGGGSV